MQTPPNRLASSLRDYFANHLPCLRGMSPHTVHSYRDTIVLLLRFIASTRKVEVCELDLANLQPDRVLAFLAHLEKDRGNSAATRNVRLAAIHAFFRYVGAQHPEHLEQAQRVLGVPFKRTDQRVIEYLDRTEIETVLAGIDRNTADGRRDYALLATMFNTGARVQEVIDLRAIPASCAAVPLIPFGETPTSHSCGFRERRFHGPIPNQGRRDSGRSTGEGCCVSRLSKRIIDSHIMHVSQSNCDSIPLFAAARTADP